MIYPFLDFFDPQTLSVFYLFLATLLTHSPQGDTSSPTPTVQGCAEYLSLSRATAAVDTLFSSSPAIRASLAEQLAARSEPWPALAPYITRDQLASLLAAADAPPGVDPARDRRPAALCVAFYAFVELILTQFRALELELRHHELAERLFASQDPLGQGRIDFPGFKAIFEAARPSYTQREIASLFTNLTRQAGSSSILTLDVFRRVAHELMLAGVVFAPVLSADPGSRHALLVRQTVTQHYAHLRPFLDALLGHLAVSERREDVAAVDACARVRALLEADLVSPPAAAAQGSSTAAGSAGLVAFSATRLLGLYRALLHVVLSHQSSWMLSAVSQLPSAPALHCELKALEHVMLFRHQLFAHGGADAEAGAWLHNLHPGLFGIGNNGSGNGNPSFIGHSGSDGVPMLTQQPSLFGGGRNGGQQQQQQDTDWLWFSCRQRQRHRRSWRARPPRHRPRHAHQRRRRRRRQCRRRCCCERGHCERALVAVQRRGGRSAQSQGHSGPPVQPCRDRKRGERQQQCGQ